MGYFTDVFVGTTLKPKQIFVVWFYVTRPRAQYKSVATYNPNTYSAE